MFFMKKKCPICGMKEKENSGIKDNSKWFCSPEHLKQYKNLNKPSKHKGHSCCK